MIRLLGVLVFALAVTGTTLAGSGLVVAPHVDPAGAPRFHDHVLAAYRFPIFLGRLSARVDPRQGLVNERSTDTTAALVLALLVIAWPRLPRPVLRPVSSLAAARMARAQWRAMPVLGPPRAHPPLA